MIESRMSRCFIFYWLVLGRGIILFYFSIHQLVFFLPVIVVICPVPLFPILVFPYILFPIRVSVWFYSSLFSLLLFISNHHSFGYSGSFITLDTFLFPFKTYFISIISEDWRRCIGIEPIYDSVSAARAGLKSGAPTSDASISVQMT